MRVRNATPDAVRPFVNRYPPLIGVVPVGQGTVCVCSCSGGSETFAERVTIVRPLVSQYAKPVSLRAGVGEKFSAVVVAPAPTSEEANGMIPPTVELKLLVKPALTGVVFFGHVAATDPMR
jgi:hypothetical protein